MYLTRGRKFLNFRSWPHSGCLQTHLAAPRTDCQAASNSISSVPKPVLSRHEPRKNLSRSRGAVPDSCRAVTGPNWRSSDGASRGTEVERKSRSQPALRNIRIKGHDVVARKLTLDTSPRRIVLLLDISGSMATLIDYSKRVTTWDDARNMAEIFLRTRFRQDLLALDVFAEEEKQIVPFTHNFDSIQTALTVVPQPKGRTDAAKALQSVLLELGPSPTFGDAVVFLSDGQFRGTSLDSLAADTGRGSVRVFLLSPRVDPDRFRVAPGSSVTSEIEAETAFMETAGGFSFAPQSVPDVEGVSELVLADPLRRVEALSNAIHGTYRLELQFERPILKKQRLELEIINDAGKSVRDVHALYPHTLYPVVDSKAP